MARTAQQPKDVLDHIRELQDRMSNVERSVRANNTAIDNGSLTVSNGAIISKHPNGVELFRTGKGSTVLPFEVDPTDGYLTRIKRANDQVVFEVFSSDDSSESRWTIHDRNGNQVLSEDYLVGKGLGRPYLRVSHYKVSEWLTPPDIITSATFAGVYILDFNLQHPAMYVNIRCTTGSDVTGELRLRDTFFAQDLWTTTVGTNFSGNLEGTGTINGLRTYGNNMTLELQARKTAGTGTMRILLANAYGRTAVSI